MLLEEAEKLFNLELSPDVYEHIERAYMANVWTDKQAFAKSFGRKGVIRAYEAVVRRDICESRAIQRKRAELARDAIEAYRSFKGRSNLDVFYWESQGRFVAFCKALGVEGAYRSDEDILEDLKEITRW
jgi:hypothetical protein